MYNRGWPVIIGRAKRAPHWVLQSRFRVIYIYVGMSALAWTKKNRSLRNGKLKAKSASETED